MINEQSPVFSESDPDGMRGVASLAKPDVRMLHMWIQDAQGTHPLTQQDRLDSISAFALGKGVPNDVGVHYDTARNLFLYAWHVYRFHAVAEQHVLGTLEMALRTRLVQLGTLNPSGLLEAALPPKGLATPRQMKPRRVMLKQMLEHAAELGLIGNDRLVNRSQWAERSAELGQLIKAAKRMEEQGLTEMEYVPEPIVLTEAERNHDWLAIFLDALPDIRNGYAHGSPNIHATVLHTFDICSDLINQLFAGVSEAS